ncbi:MAG TPA: hypothetical protein VFS41_11260 [Edaphobacter sp.]|nr:hypothetical protein [Edaphobacter sp.]
MNLSRIQQQDRPRRKHMVASPAVGAHRTAVDDPNRRHSMEVPGKLIIFVGAVQKFNTMDAGVTPYPGTFFSSQRPLSMVFLDV